MPFRESCRLEQGTRQLLLLCDTRPSRRVLLLLGSPKVGKKPLQNSLHMPLQDHGHHRFLSCIYYEGRSQSYSFEEAAIRPSNAIGKATLAMHSPNARQCCKPKETRREKMKNRLNMSNTLLTACHNPNPLPAAPCRPRHEQPRATPATYPWPPSRGHPQPSCCSPRS